MKYVSKIAVMLSLGALFASSAAFAAKTEAEAYAEAYVEAYKSSPADVPAPLTVVTPRAIVDANEEVRLTFTVNEMGRPTNIAVKSTTNKEIVDSVKDAVARWTFAPAVRDGARVATKVELPVRLLVASN
jgi:TonB family protein